MPIEVSISHMVEFWPKSHQEIADDEAPQTTMCASAESATSLATRFPGIGWPARAVNLHTHCQHVFHGVEHFFPKDIKTNLVC